MKIIKKILYYKDVGLLWQIFIASLKISFSSSMGRDQSVIASIPPVNMDGVRNADRNKIRKYVILFIFIRRKLGIRDTCLSYSILLCHMLRQAGMNAKINFGAQKSDLRKDTDIPLLGHCWITVGDEKKEAPHKLIFRYP